MSAYDTLRDFADRNDWSDDFCLALVCALMDDLEATHSLERLLSEQEDSERKWAVDSDDLD